MPIFSLFVVSVVIKYHDSVVTLLSCRSDGNQGSSSQQQPSADHSRNIRYAERCVECQSTRRCKFLALMRGTPLGLAKFQGLIANGQSPTDNKL